ncbi:hypothetical protein SAMN04488567_3775 [Limimaricola pyoseonensis]|uniref:Uncharacterized protein n=1 Tax=Limimaricola pyoseonensis TaxID=521013 RepID=A0A1G7JLM9_9RHOB|nr:hypothetical protein SAMN04488567_3775 [Limimaricola pyoseonensis]
MAVFALSLLLLLGAMAGLAIGLLAGRGAPRAGCCGGACDACPKGGRG